MRIEAEKELIQSGIISADDIHTAKLKSRSNRVSTLLNLLENRSAQSCDAIAKSLAQHYKIPLLSMKKITPPQHMVEKLNPKQARKLHFLPISEHGDQIVIGMVDPLDLNYNDEIRAIFQKSIEPVFISMSDFESNYHRFFRKGVSLPAANPTLMDTAALKKVFLNSDEPEISNDEKASIAKKFATTIISKALASKASRFCIEPQQDLSLVNLSLDGTDYNLFKFSASHHKAMIDAMMHMAKIDPLKHEGIDLFSRCQIKYREQQYILAYNFRQTPAGEQVIVHIIDPLLSNLSIEDIDLPTQALKQLKQTLEQPGIILVTGPSGSGKSTKLQAITRYLATQDKNIFTIEDIVGFKIEGVRQFQIKPHGPSKIKILKALQAKKADIIVIDEIDTESLPAILDAVDGGALVLLSISAPDISEGVSKLLRAGAPRSRLASSLKLVSTHKVIRALCPNCKTTANIHPTTKTQWQIPEHMKFQTGKGCSACDNKGYAGTLNLSEQLAISESITALIEHGASGPEIFEAARSEGMLTLIEQGFNKAIDGTTALEEVLAAVPSHEMFSLKGRMRMGRVMPLNELRATPVIAPRPFKENNTTPKSTAEEAHLPTTNVDRPIALTNLPAFTEKKPEIIKEAEKPALQPTELITQAPEHNDKANILLVDDSHVTLEFTRHILGVSGYFNVDVADTAKKALEMLQNKQYHLVITDQEMPEQTGQEFIDFIRKHPSLNNVGTILLTGNLNEMSALESGADGYIAKPTDPELLVARAKSISDIYKRLSGTPSKSEPPTFMQSPDAASGDAGKVKFTEKDMAKISGLELDIPASSSPTPAAQDEAEEDDDSSEFDSLFK